MSIPIKKYFPENSNKNTNKIRSNNNKLEKKLKERKLYWINEYKLVVLKLHDIELNTKIGSIELNELEGSVLVNHENIRQDMKKIITQLKKSINTKEDAETSVNIFYELRRDKLNILYGDYCVYVLTDGIMLENKRTCELYESFIDFLSEIKDLFYQFKFKIGKTVNIDNII